MAICSRLYKLKRKSPIGFATRWHKSAIDPFCYKEINAGRHHQEKKNCTTAAYCNPKIPSDIPGPGPGPRGRCEVFCRRLQRPRLGPARRRHGPSPRHRPRSGSMRSPGRLGREKTAFHGKAPYREHRWDWLHFQVHPNVWFVWMCFDMKIKVCTALNLLPNDQWFSTPSPAIQENNIKHQTMSAEPNSASLRIRSADPTGCETSRVLAGAVEPHLLVSPSSRQEMPRPSDGEDHFGRISQCLDERIVLADSLEDIIKARNNWGRTYWPCDGCEFM